MWPEVFNLPAVFPAICLHLIITLGRNGVHLMTVTHKDRENTYTSRHNLVFYCGFMNANYSMFSLTSLNFEASYRAAANVTE